MLEIRLECCALTPDEQSVVSAGFSRHSEEKGAPAFKKESLKWLAHEDEVLVGALTADLLWDWLYIDELWVRPR